jgi:hypothetical protein
VIDRRELSARYPHWPVAAAGLGLIVAGGLWLFSGPDTTQLDSYQECANAGYPITDTNPPACDSGSQFFLGPATSTSPSLPDASTQAFQVLVDGDSGGQYPKGEQVITNQTDWQHYWNTVHAALPAVPPILPVNFTTSNVIALSSGPETTAGYTLEIAGVTASAAGSVVSVVESVPTITCAVANTPSNRYFIATTPKLPSPVVFQVTTTPRECP